MRKTEHTVQEMKAICMEVTVVGREKGLHSEEKEEEEEEACREKEGFYTDETEEGIGGGALEDEAHER